MEHTIDASQKSLGRVASQAAAILMGKNDPSYRANTVSGNRVKIVNASKAKINTKKLKTDEYKRYSGYPGGLKIEKMEDVVAKKGYSEIFRIAVYGMLPSNKLRSIIIKNLTITE